MLTCRTHANWVADQNKHFVLSREAEYLQRKNECIEFVKRLISYLGYESEEV